MNDGDLLSLAIRISRIMRMRGTMLLSHANVIDSDGTVADIRDISVLPSAAKRPDICALLNRIAIEETRTCFMRLRDRFTWNYVIHGKQVWCMIMKYDDDGCIRSCHDCFFQIKAVRDQDRDEQLQLQLECTVPSVPETIWPIVVLYCIDYPRLDFILDIEANYDGTLIVQSQ